jgi:predicted dinucleotide-binding enzyme
MVALYYKKSEMGRLTIAIVGAEGKTGSVLAYKFAQHNRYRLLLVSEDESQLSQLSDSIMENFPDTELESIGCLKDGCWEADIIMLDVPTSSVIEVAKKIQEVATQKIVFTLSANEDNIPSPFALTGEWQQLLPNAKVVTAFNKLTTTETVLAGNDEESVQTIAEIIRKIGFQPIIISSSSAIKAL